MSNKTKKAIVIATGQPVEVYKLNRGAWCNAKDCKTEYQPNELKIQ